MLKDCMSIYFFQNLQFWLREVLVSFLLVLQMIVRVKRNAIQIPGDSIRHECCGHETCCFDFWSSSHQYFDRFSFWHICEVESAKLMHRIVFNFFHNIKTLDFINLFQLKIVIKNVLETILVVQIIMYRFLRVIILGQCHRKDVWDTIRRVLYS